MPYIGTPAVDRFTSTKAASVFSGDGSTTAFTLDHAVGSDEDILVSVDGVIQEPSVAYAVSNGTTLTFTAAPSSNSGNNIFVYYLFRTVGTVSHPSNNALTATNGNFTGTLTVVDDVSIEGSTPTLTLADTDVSNNKVELNYDEFLTLDIDPNNARGNTGLIVKGDGNEALRLTSDRHLLIGTTTDGTTAVGTVIRDAGEVLITRASNPSLLVNRTTSAGAVIEIRQDNTATGFIATPTTAANDVSFASSRGAGIRVSDQELIPTDANGGLRDNAVDCGHPSARFDDVRATNGTIQTSDRNDKQDIEELTDAEKRVAVVAKGLMRKYRWKSAVAEKGDKARTHFGIIAQDLQDAFTAESLDITKYAIFCEDVWWEVDEKTTEDGKEIIRKNSFRTEEEAPKDATKKTRLGVRYSELLAFIISAI